MDEREKIHCATNDEWETAATAQFETLWRYAVPADASIQWNEEKNEFLLTYMMSIK
jgi:hypothetical protein